MFDAAFLKSSRSCITGASGRAMHLLCLRWTGGSDDSELSESLCTGLILKSKEIMSMLALTNTVTVDRKGVEKECG